uniref:Transmembrane protein n=1 Tax=Caenorhabditis tropicalis TaxID=1561998 RepID=A0A1I7TZH3_9PELO
MIDFELDFLDDPVAPRQAMAEHGSPQTKKSEEEERKEQLLALQDVENRSASIRALQTLVIIVMILGAVQYTYVIFNHSSLLSIQFASSGLAFCCAVELVVRKWHSQKETVVQSVFLLYRTAGVIFFIAASFLNLTHCFEDISDLTEGGEAFGLDKFFASSEVTTTMAPVKEDHHHQLSENVLYLSIVDLLVKSTYAITHNALTINTFASATVLVSPSVVTILVFYYNTNELNLFNDWIDHHIEPLTSIVLTLLCLSIAIYSLVQKKQYFSVKSANENLDKVDHVHASCEWPGGFVVSLKAYIKVDKNNRGWVSQAAEDFSQLKNLLHSKIKEEGANDVIVEPVFVDHNENSSLNDPICIDSSCHNQNVGCCTNPPTTNRSEDAV